MRHDAGTPICPLCRCEGPLGHRKQMVLLLGSHSTVFGPARGTPGSSGKSSPTSQHLTQKYHYSYFSMLQVLLLQSSPFYSKWEDVRLRAISFNSVLHSSSPEFGEEIHSSLFHAEHCRRDGLLPAQACLGGEASSSLSSLERGRGGTLMYFRLPL